jgi:hypothetical protein
LDQLADDRDSPGLFEVDAEAFLSSVQMDVIRTLRNLFFFDLEGLPSFVAAARVMLDLDDRGAEIGEGHGCVRPGQNPREIQNSQSGKRARFCFIHKL